MGCCKSDQKTLSDFEDMNIINENDHSEGPQTLQKKADIKNHSNSLTDKKQYGTNKDKSILSKDNGKTHKKNNQQRNQDILNSSKASSNNSKKNLNIRSSKQLNTGKQKNQRVSNQSMINNKSKKIGGIEQNNKNQMQKFFQSPQSTLQNQRRKDAKNELAHNFNKKHNQNQNYIKNPMVKSNANPKFSKMVKNQPKRVGSSDIRGQKSQNGFKLVTSTYKKLDNVDEKPEYKHLSEKDKQFIANVQQDSDIEESDIINVDSDDTEKNMTRTQQQKKQNLADNVLAKRGTL